MKPRVRPSFTAKLCRLVLMSQQVQWCLKRLWQFGMPCVAYSKHLEDGIFEIRGKVGSDISRVLYFFYYGGKIILTNGFVKKTQKAPSKEIKRAKKYRKDYIERFGEENENLR